ncbi:MAG: phosphoribosyl-dephospho-coA transferase [Verrucomicrobia bacterium]|nr:phosphoribosyl-dephospho-coA transferase [Verrucomicrobiota bacterium]
MTSTIRPHDLYRIGPAGVASILMEAPGWVAAALNDAPYVVGTRSLAPARMAAIGVRGGSRGERFGAMVPLDHLLERTTPEFLATRAREASPRRAEIPALRALGDLATELDGSGCAWGPVGSVGFELATGRPTATPTSDLDLVLYCPQRLSKRAARQLARAMVSGDCRVDILVETPAGAISLGDFAHADGEVLLRTPLGPQLVDDAWASVSPAAALP